MAPTLECEQAIVLAGRQASLLASTDALPPGVAGAVLDRKPTEVFDLGGELLFWRVPLRERQQGYLDVAADARVGSLLLAVAPGAEWRPEELLEQARRAYAADKRGAEPDEVRFVAYSYPKIAVQFLTDGRELAMLELFTWTPVPEAVGGKEPPANFERWSYLESLGRRARARVARFEAEVESTRALPDALRLPDGRIELIDTDRIERFLTLRRGRNLHYSGRGGDHQVCYELRGQQTSVWCVAASVQMLLDFYRYNYSQVRLARDLDLGTLANPNGLPWSNIGLVVSVIESLTGNALDATMFTTNPFSRFRDEIDANRPLISFIPGHSRTVAGYTESVWVFFTAGFSGLLVYDPWPPNAGVITRWENYHASTYRGTYTARLTLA